jgi:long-subunit acyl-CoA synthetase (AMP-forming)
MTNEHSKPRADGAREVSASDYPSVNMLFARAVRRHASQPLFHLAQGWTMSYAQAGGRVLAVAKRLDQLGMKPGDEMVCYLEQTIPLALFILGCAARGVLATPLAPSFSTAYLRRLADQLGTTRVFTTPDRAAAVRAVGLEPLCFASARSDHFEAIPESTALSSAEVVSALVLAAEGTTGADAMFIQPTSGSSGQPKLVLRPHAALTRYAHFVGAEIGDGPHRFLAVAALTHALGWHMLTTAISLGAEVVLPTRLDTAASIDEIRRLDPTVLPMTPRVLRSMCRQYVFRASVNEDVPLFGPSARFLLSAGGRSDGKLLRFVTGAALSVVEFYGSSEASLVALTRRDDWREGWVGKLLPDVTVKLGTDGEIQLRSAGLMLGYHKSPELTQEAYDAEGYYLTGDLGEVTPEGYVRILGRKKDVFNTPEGSNIHPERIELMVESLRWPRQVMLIGDQRPYLTALITVRHSEGHHREHGWLDPEQDEALYRRCAEDLARLNRELEGIERIRVFLLLAEDIGEDCYCVVGPAKVRRNRKAVLERYRHHVEWLYSDGRLHQPIAAVVPPCD